MFPNIPYINIVKVCLKIISNEEKGNIFRDFRNRKLA